MAFVPAYLVFAVALIVLSTGSTALFGWRTRAGGTWVLADLDWPLLNWAR